MGDMSITGWAIGVLCAFLAGSIPFGVLIAKARGVDIREHGSKNIGATTFATAALGLAMDGKFNQMVVMNEGHIRSQDILDAADKQRLVSPDHRLINTAKAVRTCFGD